MKPKALEEVAIEIFRAIWVTRCSFGTLKP